MEVVEMNKYTLLLFILIVFLAVYPACGGGGGDNGSQPSSNWDEMVWDQDEWA